MIPGQAGADGRNRDPADGYPADSRRISVLIADDHPVVRQGLRVLLEVQDDIDVIGEAADGTAAARMAAELRPDVMLLDLKMPGIKGPEVIADLDARRIRVRILVLTSVTDPAAADAAVRAGAAGFLYKDVDPDALVRAIRSVHDGNLLLSPEAAGTLIRRGADRGATGGLAALTAREREVLALITRGKSNREIARALNVAEKTVKTHVSSVLAKLGVQDRTQAALYAVAHAGDQGWDTENGAYPPG
jgi:DNA-binding NarL/FixJ family response regulator